MDISLGRKNEKESVQAIPQNMFSAEGDSHIPGRYKAVLSDFHPGNKSPWQQRRVTGRFQPILAFITGMALVGKTHRATQELRPWGNAPNSFLVPCETWPRRQFIFQFPFKMKYGLHYHCLPCTYSVNKDFLSSMRQLLP